MRFMKLLSALLSDWCWVRWGLPQAVSAVDDEFAAAEVAGLVAEQEGHRGGDLGRLGHSVLGRGLQPLLELVLLAFQEGGGNVARCDRVHSDTAVRPLG